MWVKSLSHVRLFPTPWNVAHQAPPSMEFSRQEYWSGLPFPPPGDLSDPAIEPGSPALQTDALLSEPPGKPWGLAVNVYKRRNGDSFNSLTYKAYAWWWRKGEGSFIQTQVWWERVAPCRPALAVCGAACDRTWCSICLPRGRRVMGMLAGLDRCWGGLSLWARMLSLHLLQVFQNEDRQAFLIPIWFLLDKGTVWQLKAKRWSSIEFHPLLPKTAIGCVRRSMSVRCISF